MVLYRKRPVEVQAVQWMGDNTQEIWDAFGTESVYGLTEKNPSWLVIDTLEGKMRASVGDWIIRGVAGELYPCKPEIFNQTYEEV